MSETLCLQWNDFKENVVTAFRNLRGEKDFADVTLACEDGKQFEAHKVILASSSPFFQNLLRRNKHAHPLIYMRGLKSEDLVAIMDFLYCGEANVYQENLDSFLAIAEELQLKGLAGKANNDELETPKKRKVPVYKNEPSISSFSESPQDQIMTTEYETSIGTMSLTSNFPKDFQELDKQSTSMMMKTTSKGANGNPLYRCTVCGKEAQMSNLKGHIEAHHLDGISLPCNQCKKTFRSRNSLRVHCYSYHKRNISPQTNIFQN